MRIGRREAVELHVTCVRPIGLVRVRVVALKHLPHKLASLRLLLRTIRVRGVRRPDHNDNNRRQQRSPRDILCFSWIFALRNGERAGCPPSSRSCVSLFSVCLIVTLRKNIPLTCDGIYRSSLTARDTSLVAWPAPWQSSCLLVRRSSS